LIGSLYRITNEPGESDNVREAKSRLRWSIEEEWNEKTLHQSTTSQKSGLAQRTAGT